MSKYLVSVPVTDYYRYLIQADDEEQALTILRNCDDPEHYLHSDSIQSLDFNIDNELIEIEKVNE